MVSGHTEPASALRRVVALVALANFGYFGVEYYVARRIDSVALFADSIDFLEDTAVNVLILLALGRSAHGRARIATMLAVLLLIPGVSTLWAAYQRFTLPTTPDAALLSATAVGALVVNLWCAFLLARFRSHQGSLSRAAFLSARNDAVGNVAIVLAGFVTAVTFSPWPDLVVGLGIFAMNLDAAREVYSAASAERAAATFRART